MTSKPLRSFSRMSLGSGSADVPLRLAVVMVWGRCPNKEMLCPPDPDIMLPWPFFGDISVAHLGRVSARCSHTRKLLYSPGPSCWLLCLYVRSLSLFKHLPGSPGSFYWRMVSRNDLSIRLNIYIKTEETQNCKLSYRPWKLRESNENYEKSINHISPILLRCTQLSNFTPLP